MLCVKLAINKHHLSSSTGLQVSALLSVWKTFTPYTNAITPSTLLQWTSVIFRGFLLTPSPVWWSFFFLQCILGVNVAQGTSFANAIPASIFEIVLKYIYFLFKISSPPWNDASHLKWTFASRTAGMDPVVPPYYWAAGSASLHWKPVWLQVSREGMQKQGWPNSPSLLLIAFRKDQNELGMERFLLLLLASAKSVFMPHCKASPSSCSRSCWKPKRKDILN